MDDFKEITEGLAKIKVPVEEKISRDLPVFYNPVMKFNRDISVLILKAQAKENLKVALPLSGTGARGARFLAELPKGMLSELYANDGNPDSIPIIEKNLENTSKVQLSIECLEASRFLFSHKPYDYIDIDPFGSPNPFLDAAVKKLALGGILAVTATDTSSLCGAYTKPCLRKYWARPRNDFLMHEVGLRILIRKVQLVAGQFDRALMPILSYSKDHYMRIFFICHKGKKRVDEIIRTHGMLRDAGPIWKGSLNDHELLNKVISAAKSDEIYSDAIPFLRLLHEESIPPLDCVTGFFDIHAYAKKMKIPFVPKLETVLSSIVSEGFKASRTHFSPYGIRTDMPEDKFRELLTRLTQGSP